MTHPPTTEAEGLREAILKILWSRDIKERVPIEVINARCDQIMQLHQLETAKAVREAFYDGVEQGANAAQKTLVNTIRDSKPIGTMIKAEIELQKESE